jgi:endoglucanase
MKNLKELQNPECQFDLKKCTISDFSIEHQFLKTKRLRNFIRSINSTILIVLISTLMLVSTKVHAQTLKELRADGKIIETTDNVEVLLRGVNLGQWLNMEGFMSGSNGTMAQVDMKRKLFDAGKSATEIEGYFKQWRDNFITKADIDFVASKGYNCVRVNLHYELFLTSAQRALRNDVIYVDGATKLTKYNTYKAALKTWVDNNDLAVDETIDGFKIIDNLISWCKVNGIYIILDMHVVPGTVGGTTNITDQLYASKDFFSDSKNRLALQRIWKNISARYKGESTICMYDLINEPHDLTESDMSILRTSLNQIISDIRGNGDNKLIMLEGTEFGNQYKRNGGSYSLFPADFTNRSNLVYSMHRYRLPNNTTESNPWSLQNHVGYFADAIAFQNKYNIPLFVGETGLDNDYVQLAGNFDLMDDLKIGSTFWTLKHHTDDGNYKCPLDIPGNDPWDNLTQWYDGSLFNNIRFEKCIVNTKTSYWEAVSPRYPLVSGGTYKILNYYSGKVLDVAPPSNSAGDNVRQWTYNGTSNQHWVISYDTDWSVKSVQSGLMLEIGDNSTQPLGNARQWTSTNSNFQKWLIEWKNGHAYSITNKGSNLLLEVANSSKLDGANVQQLSTTLTNYRKWIFVPILDVSVITGFKNLSDEKSVRVYPTPVSDVLNVDGLLGHSTLKLYNSLGQLVKTFGEMSGENVRLDMTAFRPGLYFLEIGNADIRVTKKVMKY